MYKLPEASLRRRSAACGVARKYDTAAGSLFRVHSYGHATRAIRSSTSMSNVFWPSSDWVPGCSADGSAAGSRFAALPGGRFRRMCSLRTCHTTGLSLEVQHDHT